MEKGLALATTDKAAANPQSERDFDREDMFMWNIDAFMMVQWFIYMPMIIDVHASTRVVLQIYWSDVLQWLCVT